MFTKVSFPHYVFLLRIPPSQHWVPAKTTLEAGVDGLTLDDVATDSKIIGSKLHMPHKDVMPLVTPVYHACTYTVKSVDHYLDILKNVSCCFFFFAS